MWINTRVVRKQDNRMTRLYANIAVLLVASLLGGMAYFVYRGQPDDQFAQCRQSQVAVGASSIGGEFTLVNHVGETVTDKDVFTKPSLVYFGYTYCPDVCPTDNARTAEAVDLLKAQGLAVTPVFVSIDPERDTPEVMAEFVGYTHEDMIGLTGSAAQIKAASQAYKTYYKRASEDEYYLMDHTTFTYLVLPEHGFVEFFRRAVTPAQMADTVACFVGNS
jgi:protein SCO1